MKRKFFALIMAAVLCLGMSMTAFAAGNDSPEVFPEERPVTFYNKVYSNVTIAAGGGYLEKITDPVMQQNIMDRIDGERARLQEFGKYEMTYTILDQEYSYTTTAWPDYYFAFDVQGVESGQVTVHLEDEGWFEVADYIGNLVYASHYNTETGEWEVMDSFAVIDENGNVTFEFDSYSPILLTITNVASDDVAGNENFPILTTTYTPAQVLTPEKPAAAAQSTTATQSATAPKTGDNNPGYIFLIMSVAAACGLILLRKKEA